MDVRLIAAVGRDGQLGLGGKLPWHDPLDLKWFRETTMGGVVLMGGRTYDTVGQLPGRDRARWGGKTSPFTVLQQVSARHRGKTIWIAGGSWTYLSFMPFVRVAVISRIDYDGLADAYMPPLWGQLYAHGDTPSHNRNSAIANGGAGTLPTPLQDTTRTQEEGTATTKSRKRRKWSRRGSLPST